MSKIPKTIHYCWFGGGTEGELIKACKASWHLHLSDYKIQRWDESNADLSAPFLQACYKKKQWAFIADYIRLVALRDYGGIYLDTDIEVVRSFDKLLDLDAFVGEESPGRMCNAVLGAEKDNRFIDACIKYMELRWESGKSFKIGPEILGDVIVDMNDAITVLPYEFFYPYNPYDKSRPVSILLYKNVTEKTYAIHHWNKTWKFSRWEQLKRILGY